MEDHNTVLAMTSAASDMQQVLNAVWNTLLPGLQTEVSTSDAETANALAARVANLGFKPVAGQATASIANRVSSKTYIAEPNRLGVEYFTLDFTESGCTLQVKTGQGHETVSAGYGTWQEGSTALFDEIWLTGSQPFIASGSWLRDDCYSMIVRLYETPYVYTLSCQFEDDNFILTIQINVSLDSTEPHIIEAKQVPMTAE
jgi:hypothetical protein